MVKRKITGGIIRTNSKKKKHSLPGIWRKVGLKPKKQKILRTRGGTKRKVLLSEDHINLIDTKTKKAKKVKIKNILETPANRFLARENIMIRGTVIETELGKAKITNRPGQEGSVQGILLQDSKQD